MLHPLDKHLRNLLETVVGQARDIAEAASLAAVERLGVGEPAAYPHLTAAESELRRRLRAHGRQLGDQLDGKKQTVDKLVQETAYELWHRMLFARFLAENGLLMYPDPDGPIAITLEECADLAATEGARNGWDLAARYAAIMLPQIFRVDSPVFQLEFSPEHQVRLERLLADLPLEVFTASDSLGWVYQFWQAKQKAAVNASEVRIGAAELPAVTQLFTEPYMVSFLLDNSLGAWWAGQRLTIEGKKYATDEAELRDRVSLPNLPLSYLRFVQDETGEWEPAAGIFAAWPAHLKDFRLLDPCCGSGHFLVAALETLVPMRMELEGLTAKDAIDAVFRDNLHGLDIDQRVVEIAAFALALSAWRYPGSGGYRTLPPLQIACSGLSASVRREEWLRLGAGKRNLILALGHLYDSFQDAPLLGSLLNPAKSDATKLVPWSELATILHQALAGEPTVEEAEAQVTAYGLASAAALLSGQYHLVITNVPYLVRGKQSEDLRQFCELHFPVSKNDLATVFLERCLEFCAPGGSVSTVMPQNWLFLTTYRKLREKLLKTHRWHLVARLGSGAFETISGEVVKAILIVLGRGEGEAIGNLLGEGKEAHLLCGLDVSALRTAEDKAKGLVGAEVTGVEQTAQMENPDARVILEYNMEASLLSDYSYCFHGLTSGDMPRMKLMFWEFPQQQSLWFPYQGTVQDSTVHGGCEAWLRWAGGAGAILELIGARRDGREAWGRKGILVSQMGDLPVTIYSTYAFDNNCAVIIPQKPEYLPAVWCYCSSPEFKEAVRRIDQKLNVTNATLVKVPFDLVQWTQEAREKYPHGLPLPFSDDPTQWIFHGHPCGSVVWSEVAKWTVRGRMRTDDTVLQVAVARLLGYRWPAELDDEMELAAEARSLVNETSGLLSHADKDGIVCIPSVSGERRAEERLEGLLAAAYGSAWSQETKGELLAQSGFAGKTLEDWLRDGFFAQHYQLLQQRPFIWHIWDGLRDGFAALVNYHRLDRKLLEALIYTHLGDWINRQKAAKAAGIDGAEEKLVAAENLKQRLELILLGDAPYDIFVRWKPLEEHPLGWAPDLDDGVRLNIRPFMTVPDVGKKGAGVLRDRPNIKWNKDRGKDVESAPWFHRFHGDRENDVHLTLAEKRAARGKQGGRD